MARYGLYTKFAAKPGQRDALVALLLEAARGMEGSAGAECEVYIVNTSADEAEAIWVTEVWASREAHAASLALPETREAIARAMPLIAGVTQQIAVEPVGGKGLAGA
jgi:quinol monooxygenase YgiN